MFYLTTHSTHEDSDRSADMIGHPKQDIQKDVIQMLAFPGLKSDTY